MAAKTVVASLLPRLFVQQPAISLGGVLALEEAQAHYLARVLRCRTGDSVRVFDGHSGEYLAVIQSSTSSRVRIRVQQLLRPAPPPSALAPWLLHVPLRPSKQEYLVMKAVECGVDGIVAVSSEYGQYGSGAGKASPEAAAKAAGKMRAWAVEAAEQCERLTLPRILLQPKHTPLHLHAAVADWCGVQAEDGGSSAAQASWLAGVPARRVLLVCDEGERVSTAASAAAAADAAAAPPAPAAAAGASASEGRARTGCDTNMFTAVRKLLGNGSGSSSAGAPCAVGVLVGPEGGWSPQERAAFRQLELELQGSQHLARVTLGPLVYRAETAAVAALAQLQLALQELSR